MSYINYIRQCLAETRMSPLYHFTGFDESWGIVTQDLMKAGQNGTVSFTRDPRHLFGRTASFVYVFDEAKLTQNFRLEPSYGDIETKGRSNYQGFDKSRESEERIVGDIPNLHRYLIGIGVTWNRPSMHHRYDAILRKVKNYAGTHKLRFDDNMNFNSVGWQRKDMAPAPDPVPEPPREKIPAISRFNFDKIGRKLSGRMGR